MTKRKVIEYFSKCEEHYPMSDEFVKKYQQNKGNLPQADNGYIKKAYDLGIEINAEKAEPNQKWHLLQSYYKIEKNDIESKAFDKRVTIWCKGNKETGKGGSGLKCPELLLWIAEAAGCDVREAKLEAEKLCEKGERLLACNVIKNMIPWKKIEKCILDKQKDQK